MTFEQLNYKLGSFDQVLAAGRLPFRGMSFGTVQSDALLKYKSNPYVPDTFESVDKDSILGQRLILENEDRLKVAKWIYENIFGTGLEFSTAPKEPERTAKISKMKLHSDEYGTDVIINYCATARSKEATEKRWKKGKLPGKPRYIPSGVLSFKSLVNAYLAGVVALPIQCFRTNKNRINVADIKKTEEFWFYVAPPFHNISPKELKKEI